MLWVLKRTISLRDSFKHPKHMLKSMGKKYLQVYTENICLSKPVTKMYRLHGRIIADGLTDGGLGG